MKKTQRLTAVFLLLLILCGCSTPTAPDTIVMPQTSAETRTEPAPVSAEPEPGVFHQAHERKPRLRNAAEKERAVQHGQHRDGRKRLRQRGLLVFQMKHAGFRFC